MKRNKKFSGIGVSSGIAKGKAYLFAGERFAVPRINIRTAEIEREIDRFKKALAETAGEIQQLRKKVSLEIGKELSSVLDVHVLVLEDTLLIEKTVERVNKEKVNVEYVFSKVIEEVAGAISRSDDSYLKGRAADVRDVGKRVLRNMLGKEEKSLEDVAGPVIVVAYDLSPADTAAMDTKKVLGFVTDIGSKTSHTAIMARSLEIPAVVGLGDSSSQIAPGKEVIVNGDNGVVIVNPREKQRRDYEKKKVLFDVKARERHELSRLRAQTKDGHIVKLMANIELRDELGAVKKHGADGIGLYRTEYLYVNNAKLPTEDEQYEIYRYIVGKVAPRGVVIRTMDLGGDKFVSPVKISGELNPFMGWRGIRFSLGMPDIFRVQLRAILRASSHGKVSMMLPMVSTLSELVKAKKFIAEEKGKLKSEGKSFDENIELGVMIETPSAAMIADMLADEVAFFSIGTNDLIQYALAIDRVNERVAYLYKPTHPGVLRIIKNVVDAGHSKGIRVDMCGEMAGNPQLAFVLLGIGIDGFSMSPIAIPAVKMKIRAVKISQAKELASELLELSTAGEVERVLKKREKKILGAGMAEAK